MAKRYIDAEKLKDAFHTEDVKREGAKTEIK